MHGPGTETLVLGAGGLASAGHPGLLPVSPSPTSGGGGGTTKDANRALLQTLVLVGSALSVVGSFFIILSYFLFKDSRKFSRKILLYLSFADMMASTAWVLQYIVPADAGGMAGGALANTTRAHTLCEVQGYLLQFFYLASYVWTGCFAWHLYQVSQECCILLVGAETGEIYHLNFSGQWTLTLSSFPKHTRAHTLFPSFFFWFVRVFFFSFFFSP